MVDKLTRMERECVRETGNGLRNAEIGGRLGISANTVDTHLTHAYEKLGLHGREARTLAAVKLYCAEHKSHTAALVDEGR